MCRYANESCRMLKSLINVKVSDTTEVDSSNAVKCIKTSYPVKTIFLKTILQIGIPYAFLKYL
jgi:hypothetical protein